MPTPRTTALALIESKLRDALSPEHLEIVDESHLHAGHAGARGGGGHFALTIVSATFSGLGPAQRHRLVYGILAEEMREAIHALAIRALSPEEWISRRADLPPTTRP